MYLCRCGCGCPYPHSCRDLIGAPSFSSIQSEALWENLQTHRYKTLVTSLRHEEWFKALPFIKNMYYNIIRQTWIIDLIFLFVFAWLTKIVYTLEYPRMHHHFSVFLRILFISNVHESRIKYYKLVLKPYLWTRRLLSLYTLLNLTVMYLNRI